MEIQHSFIKGMNRDFSKNKFPKEAYYYLLNGRILNDDDASLSDIINLKGNTEANINDNSLVRSNYSIIGYTTIQNDIILFYAETTATGVDDYTSYSIIDRLVYLGNNAYSRVEIWNGIGLNFRIDKKIRAVSIYESENVEKIYWVDDNNSMKQANIAEDISSQIANQFDIYGDLNGMYAPQWSDYTSGSLKSGSIAYAYRLIKKNGYKTVFSDISELAPLGKNIHVYQTIRRMYGDAIYDPDSSYNSGKGVVLAIYITNSDYFDYYDYIEVVSLWYSSDSAIPDINIIDKIKLESGVGTYRIIDTGTNSYGTLTLAEFTNQNYSFIGKDLAIKDNRLFVANINEEYFDLDEDAAWTGKSIGELWDARSYRFDDSANPKAELKNLVTDPSPTYTLYASTLLYDTIPDTANAINIFNNINQTVTDEQNSTGALQQYQSNGSTLGGSGSNISYSFTYEDFYLISYSNLSPSLDGSITNIEQLGINKTFQRDEVYRFGIVFFDKKGRQSFVKWIGDIRIPEASGAGDSGRIAYSPSTNNVNGMNIYPTFSISNIPTINGDPLDYQIVYVKREEADKSIVASGMICPTERHSSGSRPTASPWQIGSYVSNAGSSVGDLNKQLFNFISPEINFRDKEYITGTFLHIPTARLSSSGGVQAQIIDGTWTWVYTNNDDTIFGDSRVYIRKYDELNDNPLHPYNIRTTILDISKTIPPTNIDFSISIDVETYAHYCYDDNGGTISSPHGTCLTFKTNNVLAAYASDSDFFYGYLRKNVYQSAYGGISYNNRQLNTYIPASSKTSGSTSSVACKYGDTIVTMFEYGKFFVQDSPSGAANSIATFEYFPCESSINCLLNSNDTYSRTYFIYPLRAPAHINESAYIYADLGLSFTSMYGYNDAYSKLEDSKKFIVKPILFEDISENSARIKYSDLKIENEDIDSWLNFRVNNFKDANENYGEINRIIEFNDRIFNFQNNAVSVISINPRVTQQSSDGVSIILGSGEVIDKYNYLTTSIGCQDNSDIVSSLSALYWLDKNKKKIYSFNGQIESVTDLKGMHSYLKNNIYEDSEFIGAYDIANSEVIMTITDSNPNTLFEASLVSGTTWDLLGPTSTIEIPFIVGRVYKISSGYFIYISKTSSSYRFSYSHGITLTNGVEYDLSTYITERDNFTIVYNEKMQAFSSFYSFIPDLYINHNRDYFTSQNSRDLWQHNIGEEYNTFYNITYPTTLKLIAGFGSQIQAEYTNIKFFAEICNTTGELLPNETISNISLKDATQISDDIILYPIHLVTEYKGDRYVLDTSGLRIGRDWYTGLVTPTEGLVVNNNQLYRNTSLGDLSTPPPNTGWSVSELCNIRKTDNHWITQLPRFLYRENLTDDHEYALSNRFRSDWLEITLEFKDMIPGINLCDRRLKLSDIKLIYSSLNF